MSNELTIDSTMGVNVQDIANRVEKFLNDPEISKDHDLSAKILLPESHGTDSIKLAFEPRLTKAAILEVLGCVFAEPQPDTPSTVETEAPPEETVAKAEAKPKKSKKTKDAPVEEPAAEEAPQE